MSMVYQNAGQEKEAYMKFPSKFAEKYLYDTKIITPTSSAAVIYSLYQNVKLHFVFVASRN